jgi:methylase of polypeptide subunit release factors
MTPSSFDARRVLASAAAMGALAKLAAVLRACSYDNRPRDEAPPGVRVACELALGHDVDREDVPADLLDAADLDALVDASALDHSTGVLAPQFALYASGATLVLVPRDDGEAPDRVYFARDTLMLSDLVLQAGPGQGLAADLGTGPGTVAVHLAGDYDLVVGTDLLPRTAACAAITLRLNPRSDGRPAGSVCVADVAACLRPGRFDLVAANPPWMPDLPDGRVLAFASGGPTGFELPRRFVMEAIGLLAPGGVAVIVTGDLTWDDGSRPLLALARGVGRLGYEVAIVPTDAAAAWPDFEARLRERYDSLAAAGHAGLVIRRGATATRPGSA